MKQGSEETLDAFFKEQGGATTMLETTLDLV